MDEPPFELTDAAVLRAARTVRLRVGIPFAIAGAIGVASVVVSSLAVLQLAVFGGILAAINAFAALRDPTLADAARGPLRIDAAVVKLPDGRRVRRAALQDGLVRPLRDGAALVELGGEGQSPIKLRVRDVAEGRRVLRALGLDVSQTTARFELASRLATSPLGSFALVFGAALASIALVVSELGVLVPCVFLVVLGLWTFERTRVEVGADGLSIRWLGSRRFVPIGEIADVRVSSRRTFARGWVTVQLTLRSGERVELGVAPRGRNDGRAQMVCERVRQALAGTRNADLAASAALLARGERPLSEWVRAARGVGAGASAALRVAPIDEDTLWRIVEDAALDGSARAGAALALHAGALDTSGKARLRRVAEATVSAPVREVLERAAGEDEAALEQALAALEPSRRA